MVGKRYWSTGITLKYMYSGGGKFKWWASIEFYDDGFCDVGSTQGYLTTRYGQTITSAIDTIKLDAEKLGIDFRDDIPGCPMLYYVDDGDSEDYPPPKKWKKLLRKQSKRIGFETYQERR